MNDQDYQLATRIITEVTWNGPYSWPSYEGKNNLPPLPQTSGVYLQTFAYQKGYLIYSAGLTRRSMPERFREHTRKYMNGEYNVLDIGTVRQGVRKEIWHGWDYRRKHQEAFENHRSAILDAVNKQLVEFCIFVGDVSIESRVLERLEAAIMNNLYQQLPPISEIPDRGMQLSPKQVKEEPIIVKNCCAAVLHGLPLLLEI